MFKRSAHLLTQNAQKKELSGQKGDQLLSFPQAQAQLPASQALAASQAPAASHILAAVEGVALPQLAVLPSVGATFRSCPSFPPGRLELFGSGLARFPRSCPGCPSFAEFWHCWTLHCHDGNEEKKTKIYLININGYAE